MGGINPPLSPWSLPLLAWGRKVRHFRPQEHYQKKAKGMDGGLSGASQTRLSAFSGSRKQQFTALKTSWTKTWSAPKNPHEGPSQVRDVGQLFGVRTDQEHNPCSKQGGEKNYSNFHPKWWWWWWWFGMKDAAYLSNPSKTSLNLPQSLWQRKAILSNFDS